MSRKVRIKLEDIDAGQVEEDIYDDKGQLLLGKGSVLTSQTIRSLQGRSINEVFILLEEPEVSAISQYPQTESRGMASPPAVQIGEVYGKAIHFVEGFMSDIRQNKEFDISSVERTVSFFSDNVLSEADLLRQVRLIKDKDAYLYTHSVNVSILSIMMGRWLELDAPSIKKLGVAGMLHDIGKVHIPDNILNKPAALSDNEYQIIKNHSVIGYRLIKDHPGLDPQIMYGVLMHHERMDGSGYPAGIDHSRIPSLASVIAIADTYDAITSKRVYSEKRTPYVAADIIIKESLAGKVDPLISKVFYDNLLALSVDDQVLLSNREIGHVVLINPLKPAYPVVKVKNELYYLDREPELTIVEVL